MGSQAVETTSDSDILEKLHRTLAVLVERDGFILKDQTNERAISFRLAMHLQALLPEWNVDCEYNCWESQCQYMRHVITSTTSAATEARTIFPDIVVHRRGTSDNLAVIELLKSTNRFSTHQDIKKLKAYQHQLGYRYAILLNVGVGDEFGNNRVETV